MNHHHLNDPRQEQIAFIRNQILNLSQQLMKEQHYFKTYGYGFHNYNLDIAPSDIKKELSITKSKLPVFSIQTIHSLDVAPENKTKLQTNNTNITTDLKLKWKKLYKTVKEKNMKENKSAYFIQTIWRRANGKSDSDFNPPDLHLFFHLDLEDYQQAELMAIHNVSDEILHSSVQSILFEKEQEFEEEEEEGGLEEEAEASTDVDEEINAEIEEEEEVLDEN